MEITIKNINNSLFIIYMNIYIKLPDNIITIDYNNWYKILEEIKEIDKFNEKEICVNEKYVIADCCGNDWDDFE